jgi:hypothetical protein
VPFGYPYLPKQKPAMDTFQKSLPSLLQCGVVLIVTVLSYPSARVPLLAINSSLFQTVVE